VRRHAPHDEAALRYQLREGLLSISDDYWIENGHGQRAYRVDGKAMRFRKTLILEDPTGRRVAEFQERKLSVRDAIRIELDGREATVKKALVGLRDRFRVEVEGGEDLKIVGNIVDHEYEVERRGTKVATVSKRWFRIRDSYGIETRDVSDVPLMLAVAVALDAMAHDWPARVAAAGVRLGGNRHEVA
jgi:uncharacterized protein YxjI